VGFKIDMRCKYKETSGCVHEAAMRHPPETRVCIYDYTDLHLIKFFTSCSFEKEVMKIPVVSKKMVTKLKVPKLRIKI